jgi:hypothetical protein
MITFGNGLMEEHVALEQNPLMNNLNLITSPSDDPIEEAKSMANNIPEYIHKNVDFHREPPLNIPEEYKKFIWFIIPRQVILQIINDYEQNGPTKSPPFHPRSVAQKDLTNE